MKKMYVFLLTFFLIISTGSLTGQRSNFTYVGVKKCKICHNKAITGKQYSLWQQRRHSKAFEVLATEQSKDIAKKLGIKKDPQQADECLRCHITAFDASTTVRSELTNEESVSCEACHGPGSGYRTLKIMRGINTGKLKKEDYGMIEITEELCIACHNKQSPTYKPFNYKRDVKAIDHPLVDLTKE